MDTRNARRIAVSLLALGGATAAIVFGSWAAWTAATTNPGNTVTTGNLGLTTDKPGTHVLKVEGVIPGDSGEDQVTVSNEGSVPLALTLTQEDVVREAGPALKLQIFDGTNCIYPAKAGACGTDYAAWDGTATIDGLDQGTLAADGDAGDEKTYTVGWILEDSSVNADQDTTNSFSLVWDGSPA